MIYLFLLFFFATVTGEPVHCQAIIEKPWQRPETLDAESWELAKPHLLPSNHHLRAKLDALFAKKRPNISMQTMEDAGFFCRHLRNWDNIVVAAHHKLKGYLVKTYLDDQLGVTELYELLKRINGAHVIRETIEAFHFESHFKVPKKWLYPLPDVQTTPLQMHFLLIVEDMKLVSDLSNPRKWKKKITRERLKALYLLLNHGGLKDSVFISNIPFSKDGRLAFIDTEHYHGWPVPFHRLTHFLNPVMQEYWNHLIITNGQG